MCHRNVFITQPTHNKYIRNIWCIIRNFNIKMCVLLLFYTHFIIKMCVKYKFINDTQCSIKTYVKIYEDSRVTLIVTMINLKTKVTAFI